MQFSFFDFLNILASEIKLGVGSLGVFLSYKTDVLFGEKMCQIATPDIRRSVSKKDWTRRLSIHVTPATSQQSL